MLRREKKTAAALFREPVVGCKPACGASVYNWSPSSLPEPIRSKAGRLAPLPGRGLVGGLEGRSGDRRLNQGWYRVSYSRP